MRSFSTALILSLATGALAQSPFENVLIYAQEKGKYPPCEPSIAIHPEDPSVIVAGAVLDYVFTSSDSGKSWSADHLQSRYGVYGDPCIIADASGNFYYFHLSNPSGEGWSNPDILDRIVCQRSGDEGKHWDRGTGIGHNGSKDQDKEWAVYDPLNDVLFLTWTEFDRYGSDDPECKSRILFSGSADQGQSWSRPLPVGAERGNCLDRSQTAEGAVPAVDHKGNFYTTFSLDGKLWFYAFPPMDFTGSNADTSSGDTAGMPPEHENALSGRKARAIADSAYWTFDIPGIGRANGMPVTRCDRSNGPHRGTIYVNWADQRNGSNDTDIWLMKSTDRGQTWSKPVRVNDDGPGKHQFFTWMDIDQSTGYLYIVFYDRRNYEDERTDVYLAVSRDGGDTFENLRISASPFNPVNGVFFGDYNNISAVNGVIRPVWTRNDEGKLSIWTALVHENQLKD